MSSVAHHPRVPLGDEHGAGAPVVDEGLLIARALGAEQILQGPSRRSAGHVVGVVAGGAFVALLAGAVVYATLWPPLVDRLGPNPLIGRAAPQFSGEQMIGQPADAVFPSPGRWMVLNFFATWCRPCRAEVPELVRFADGHGDVGLVTVAYNDDTEQVRALIESRGGHWPVLADRGGGVARQYALRAVPDTFLVDPEGIVVAAIVGGVTSEGLESTLIKFQSQRKS